MPFAIYLLSASSLNHTPSFKGVPYVRKLCYSANPNRMGRVDLNPQCKEK